MIYFDAINSGIKLSPKFEFMTILAKNSWNSISTGLSAVLVCDINVLKSIVVNNTACTSPELADILEQTETNSG